MKFILLLYTSLISIQLWAQKVEESDSLVWVNANKNTLYKMDRGDVLEAIDMGKAVIDIAKIVFHQNHECVAISLINLAFYYSSIHEFDSAEVLLKKSLKIRRKNLNFNIEEYLQNLYDLGILYKETDRLYLAELIFKECIALNKRYKRLDHYFESMNSLGLLYIDMEKQHAALKLLLKSVEDYSTLKQKYLKLS